MIASSDVRMGNMPTYIALLRAVNVGGTGKLPMAELKAMCAAEGFAKVETYIASGNVVFQAGKSAGIVKALLEKRLGAYAGKTVGVVIRAAHEMEEILKANPFAKAPPNATVAIFLDEAPPKDALEGVRGLAAEKPGLGRRET